MNRIDPNITFLYNLRALLKLSKPRVRLSIVVPDPDTTTCSDGRDPKVVVLGIAVKLTV